MPLQQLVEHFNNRFAYENQARLHPFTIDKDQVNGLFGPIRISSGFDLIRKTENYESIVGHSAHITVAPSSSQDLGITNLGHLLTHTVKESEDFQSIINLDRLSRTVHMLNYLKLIQLGGTLFLDVDPRHILSVKKDHGVYFEEIIIKCGLVTNKVAISLSITPFYALHHTQLLVGLHNYRQRGYKIALNIGPLYTTNGLQDLMSKLAPDYLRINAPSIDKPTSSGDPFWPSALKSLAELQRLLGGQTLLQQVDHQEQAWIAPSIGIDLIQGQYCDKVVVDHLRCL